MKKSVNGHENPFDRFIFTNQYTHSSVLDTFIAFLQFYTLAITNKKGLE